MGKKTGQNQKSSGAKKVMPFVSVCTPTFNRRPFIQMMFNCFRNQDYPKSRMEWIIVDDGTDKIADLIANANISQIKYFPMDGKMSLGEKRNYMHEKAKGSFIVYMDDDDYYPPERVSHAIDTLLKNPKAMCAGSSELYIYFDHIQKMYQGGPYGPNHATAGTFAFRKELLETTKYESHAALAEEKAFLKNYTVPFVQLDPMKAILVFSHDHNTFDKKKLLENPHPQYFKESPKRIDEFIRHPYEAGIKQFFLYEMKDALNNYEPGKPTMKPDVIVQMKQIEAEREKMARDMQQQQQQGIPQIMMERPGQPPVPMTTEQIVTCLKQQQEQIAQFIARIQEMEGTINSLQAQLAEKNNELQSVSLNTDTDTNTSTNENIQISL